MVSGSSPRVRGTHKCCLETLVDTGSSPRVRGTHLHNEFIWSLWRFIPARAGNSSTAMLMWSRWAVHPRACGELALKATLTKTALRFIPARAGNSRYSSLAGVIGAVHPRACGELLLPTIAPN